MEKQVLEGEERTTFRLLQKSVVSLEARKSRRYLLRGHRQEHLGQLSKQVAALEAAMEEWAEASVECLLLLLNPNRCRLKLPRWQGEVDTLETCLRLLR